MAWASKATEVYNGETKLEPTRMYFRPLSNYANLAGCVQILYFTRPLISWSIIFYKQLLLLQQAGGGILHRHINITQGNQDERITYVQYLARNTC